MLSLSPGKDPGSSFKHFATHTIMLDFQQLLSNETKRTYDEWIVFHSTCIQIVFTSAYLLQRTNRDDITNAATVQGRHEIVNSSRVIELRLGRNHYTMFWQ